MRLFRALLPLSMTSSTVTADPVAPITLRAKDGRVLERRVNDRSQALRRGVQWAFLLLNVFIGWRFYLWVRHYETFGLSAPVTRPPGVEGWLPIAALMNLKYFVVTGTVPDTHPAGMFLLIAFLGMSIALRKSFCSWLCPIGTISEWLWQGGQELFGRTWRLPRWLDIPLRSLKYILLALFVYVVAIMSADEIRGFLMSPYGVIADVKMLNFFREMGRTAALVITGLVVLSVFVKNAWCRLLCPYGALMGIAALFSPAGIRRTPEACIDCNKCAQACPSLLPVDQLLRVRSAECTTCLSCVAACPVKDALACTVPRGRVLTPWMVASGVALFFIGAVGVARVTGHWHTEVPEAVLRELIGNAASYGHPGR